MFCVSSRIKDLKEKLFKKSQDSSYNRTRNESDWEYNTRKKKEQEEIDHILDKIRKSGYDSLTEEEKKKLFENGKH